MIGIIDYGLGNIKAIAHIFKELNVPYCLAKSVEDLKKADKLLLPGVGAFDHAMNQLAASGMRDYLDQLVLEEKKPILGICVGMQMMAKSSQEGNQKGLGWIDGEVCKFDINKIQQTTRLPHMGWNDVKVVSANSLFDDLEQDSRFYFLHSFYFKCNNDYNCLAKSEYGIDFACAVNQDNIYGVQFHPEKSHHFGIQLLKNFSSL